MQITPMKPEAALRDPHPPGKSTIYGLQALRFIAAAMVVVTHALNREVNIYHPFPLPRAPWMESGVDIFFIISGFIMVYIIKPETTPGAFWLQRFTRIAPLYWVATAIAFVGGLVLPDWFFGRQGWGFALQSALFMPLGGDANTHPLISPGWTLIFEFAFYTILALCMIVRRPPFVLAIGVIVAIMVVGSLFRAALPPLGYYASDLLLAEFLFGMAAAWLVRRFPIKPWQGLVLTAIGLALIYVLFDLPDGYPRGIKIGLPALLTVCGILASEPMWQRHRWMQQFARLGDASYSIYIVHFFFVTAVATWFVQDKWVHDTVGPLGFTALMIIAGIGSGIVAHIFIEKPLLKGVRGLLPKRAPAPVGGTVKV